MRAAVEMRNTGTATWTREGGYKLGAVDDADPFFAEGRVWLPEGGAAVASGESWTFEMDLVAPREPGVYTTDWQMVHEGVRWFGAIARVEVVVSCDRTGRSGPVRLNGNSLEDDDGTFWALGATIMWAAWGYKFDRARLEENLAFLADNGFDYFRALGVVGDYDNDPAGDPEYWDGREIDWHWDDYDEVIAGLTDLAFQEYGLRVEWTLIGDGQKNLPERADREALVDRFVAMSVGREEEILHFEIANEAWQNGFGGDDGLAELLALTRRMRDATDILVAASAPEGVECEDLQRVYAGGDADIATIHFDRNPAEDGWRPVRQPWGLYGECSDIPVASNNEPIGPGASVSSEEDPVRLVAGALVTYVSNLPMYVWHTHAGVRGDQDLWEYPGGTSFGALREIVPGDLPSWTRRNAHWGDAPFQAFASGADGRLLADTMWPDLPDATSGAVRVYGDVSGDEFFVVPFGILGSVTLAPRWDVTFDVLDPMTGELVESRQAAAGEQFVLDEGRFFVLRGSAL